jgi:hypothetical protein
MMKTSKTKESTQLITASALVDTLTSVFFSFQYCITVLLRGNMHQIMPNIVLEDAKDTTRQGGLRTYLPQMCRYAGCEQ